MLIHPGLSALPSLLPLLPLLLLLLLLLLLWLLASCSSRRSRTSLQHSRAARVLGDASTSCCRQVVQGAVSSHSRPHLAARLARLSVSSAGALYTMSHTCRRGTDRQQQQQEQEQQQQRQPVSDQQALCDGAWHTCHRRTHRHQPMKEWWDHFWKRAVHGHVRHKQAVLTQHVVSCIWVQQAIAGTYLKLSAYGSPTGVAQPAASHSDNSCLQ
jgi:hypothetical protein